MTVSIKYNFIPMGASVGEAFSNDSPRQIKRNRIFLDVGRQLRKGVIDHHQPGKYISAASALFANPVLVSSWVDIDDIASGKTPVELVLHYDPNLDCCACAYMVEELINRYISGKGWTFSPHTEQLVKYVEVEDNGQYILSSDGNDASLMGMLEFVAVVVYCQEKLQSQGLALPKGPWSSWNVAKQEICSAIKDCLTTSNISIREIKAKHSSTSAVAARGVQFIRTWMELFTKKEAEYFSKHQEHLVLLYSEKEIIMKDDLITSNEQEDNFFIYELALLTDDYQRYQHDLASEGIVEKIILELPSIDNQEKSVEVKGLFWSKPPSCLWDYQWAYYDTSQETHGYDFVFVPDYVPCTSNDSNKVYSLNRVRISVNPARQVSIKGLGEALERVERQTELQKIKLEGTKFKPRITFPRRYDETWCETDDPWYDGRHHNHTIIDAPRRGSLLDIEKIKDITLRYYQPQVQELSVRLIFAFNEELKNKDIFLQPKENDPIPPFEIQETNINKIERQCYFLPYIQEYWFSGHRHKKSSADWYRITIPLTSDDGITAYLTAFRYGTGFVSVDISYSEYCQLLSQKPSLESILEFHHLLGNQCKCHIMGKDNTVKNTIMEKIDKLLVKAIELLDNSKNDCTQWQKFFSTPMIYVSAGISSSVYFRKHYQDMVHKLCNFQQLSEPDIPSNYYEQLHNKISVDIQKKVAFGFAQNGSCMLYVCDSQNGTESEIKASNRYYRRKFWTTDFDIFCLAFHQRNILLKISYQQFTLDNDYENDKISDLRRQLLHFTTQSWFSQITSDDIGASKYRKWQELFENQGLYNEVFQELEAVYNFNRSEATKKYEFLSAAILPIVMMGAILGMNIFGKDELLLFSFGFDLNKIPKWLIWVNGLIYPVVAVILYRIFYPIAIAICKYCKKCFDKM